MQAERENSLEDLLQQCTVKLKVAGKSGWGTGYFVAPGLILTCAHVIKDAGDRSISVSWQGQENVTEAKVQMSVADPFDIALLEFAPGDLVHPCVYLDRGAQAGDGVRSGDELYAYGYPDDNPNGAPVTGQCEGLTGDKPPIIKFKQGQVRPGLSGSPLLNRRTNRVCGIVKFTRDRSNDLGGGAVPATAVFEKFSELRSLQTEFHQKDSRWRSLLPLERPSLKRVVLTSLGATITVMLFRFLGGLQFFELMLYDQFVRLQGTVTPESRIVVVEIRPEDIVYQQQNQEQLLGSISNQSLNALLKKLDEYKPKAIGLDLYRDNKLDLSQKADQELAQRFKTQANLFGVCKARDEDLGVDIIPPPPGMPIERVGFSDFFLDDDNILRRQLLAFETDSSDTPANSSSAASACPGAASFNLRLASFYLQARQQIQTALPLQESSFCNDVRFSNGASIKQFHPYTGGYQGDRKYQDCQVVLHYQRNREANRAFPDYKIAQFYSLEEVLNDRVKPEDFRERIVLVGTLRRGDGEDFWSTPFSTKTEDLMPGVWLQAQMISHLLKSAEGERSPIWVLPLWGEALWMFSWGMVGGLIGLWVRSPSKLSLSLFASGTVLYGICRIVFEFSGWLPLLPAMVVMVIPGVGLWWIALNR